MSGCRSEPSVALGASVSHCLDRAEKQLSLVRKLLCEDEGKYTDRS